MNTKELINSLNRMKVQTGSLVCLGCGHEHNCGVHGCAVLREAAVRLSLYEYTLKQVAKERDAAVKQLRQIASCETCKHVEQCSEGCETYIACSIGQNWEWNGGTPCTF